MKMISVVLLAICFCFSGCTVYITSADKDIMVEVEMESCTDTNISPDLSSLTGGPTALDADNMAETNVDPDSLGAAVGEAVKTIIPEPKI